jgi:uncharacterized membrane protein
MQSMQIAQWLHVLGVVVWVGGMFFAHMALRPAVQSLEPPMRLPLLAETMRRFFAWVAAAVIAIVATGFWMVFLMGGFARVAPHVHLMTAIGIAMAAIYVWIVAVPFRALAAAVRDRRWPDGGAAMGRIRLLVAVNLVLGLVTFTIAILGHGL